MNDHPTKKNAVILVNLGTPAAPARDAITTYLQEFLMDRHVVDLPAFFWKPLLTRVILPRRLRTTVANYQKIWMKEGSPLAYYSQQLVLAVKKQLPENWHCCLGMTYGEPSLANALAEVKEYQNIKIIPLFPHYSTTTTQAVLDKIRGIVARWDRAPSMDYIFDYADHPKYIHALATQVEKAFTQHGKPDHLILSYHGIPERYVRRRGDPYLKRCLVTTEHLTRVLNETNPGVPISHAYQSRFGKGRWSMPNITPLLGQLGSQTSKHIHVMCPGFAVDCVETLEEIEHENKDHFLSSGGKTFHYIPALNDSEAHCQLMLSLIKEAGLPLTSPRQEERLKLPC